MKCSFCKSATAVATTPNQAVGCCNACAEVAFDLGKRAIAGVNRPYTGPGAQLSRGDALAAQHRHGKPTRPAFTAAEQRRRVELFARREARLDAREQVEAAGLRHQEEPV